MVDKEHTWEKHPHVVNEIITQSKNKRKYYLSKTKAKSRNRRAQERNEETTK